MTEHGRLIDADELLKNVHTIVRLTEKSEQIESVIYADEIENATTIEPERKKGKWIWDENGMDWGLGAWKCNRCLSKAETWWANDKKYNPLRCAGGRFCGVCGAQMESMEK